MRILRKIRTSPVRCVSSNHRFVIASSSGSLFQNKTTSIEFACSQRIFSQSRRRVGFVLRVVVDRDQLQVARMGSLDPGPELHREVIVQRLVVVPDDVAGVDSQPVFSVEQRVGAEPAFGKSRAA